MKTCIVYHCSFVHNLSSCKIEAWNKFRPEWDSNPWPCNTGVMLWSMKPTWSWSHCYCTVVCIISVMTSREWIQHTLIYSVKSEYITWSWRNSNHNIPPLWNYKSFIHNFSCKLEQPNQKLFLLLFKNSYCDKVMIHILGSLSGILVWHFSTQGMSQKDLF